MTFLRHPPFHVTIYHEIRPYWKTGFYQLHHSVAYLMAGESRCWRGGQLTAIHLFPVFPGHFHLNLEKCSIFLRGTHISRNLYEENRKACTPVYLMSIKCSHRADTSWPICAYRFVSMSVAYDMALLVYASNHALSIAS